MTTCREPTDAIDATGSRFFPDVATLRRAGDSGRFAASARNDTLVTAAVLVVAACTRAPSPTTDSAAVAAPVVIDVTPPDSSALAEASKALASYLEASREGSPTRDSLPQLTACPNEIDTASGPMLAGYTVLPASARADTVVGRAVVTTVADQDIDRQRPGYFIARIRVRSDTLEWDVLRAESGDWVVCNGLRFGLTAPDSLTAWRPNGASVDTARALADSIGARR